MIKKYQQFYNKINEETGFRNVRKIISDHISENGPNFEIFFHQDLDGVCSGLCIKEYLKKYGLVLVDTHIIQYGSVEFIVKEKRADSMGVLVDFAHSSTQYTIVTDHHDKQTGVVPGQSTHFKHSRSNAETISGIISPTDIFTATDINLIRTVDSADFLKYDIKPEDIQNAIFNYKRDLSPERNRFLMGFVVNRLLLAFKTKKITVTSLDGKNNHINKNILECLLIDSSPSLYSMFNNLRHYINTAISLEWDRSERSHQTPKKLLTPEELTDNLNKYIETRKEYIKTPSGVLKHKDIDYDANYKILKQYHIGYVIPTGSYDRYVVFKNFPDADFVCTIFTMGLIQVSCNPFKEKRLKDINLGKIAEEVLDTYKYNFSRCNISINDIKRISEIDMGKMKKKYGDDYKGVGFRFDDLLSFYKDSIIYLPNRESGDMKTSKLDLSDENNENVILLHEWMDVLYEDWPDEIKEKMKWLKIPIWDIIIGSSGGHPSITNIQGLNYLGCREDFLKRFNKEKYTDVMRVIADTFIDKLKEKIDQSRKGEVDYEKTGVELKGGIANE